MNDNVGIYVVRISCVLACVRSLLCAFARSHACMRACVCWTDTRQKHIEIISLSRNTRKFMKIKSSPSISFPRFALVARIVKYPESKNNVQLFKTKIFTYPSILGVGEWRYIYRNALTYEIYCSAFRHLTQL